MRETLPYDKDPDGSREPGGSHIIGYPNPEEIAPHKRHTHTAIILHGRGDTGANFGAQLLMAPSSNGQTLREALPNFKFVFPTAKLRPVAVLRGEPKHQWFDIWSIQDQTKHPEVQQEGICESSAHLHRIIETEAALVGVDRVFLGGLSQGMALGLHVLLSYTAAASEVTQEQEPQHLPGFFGMSGWLPFADSFRNTSLWMDDMDDSCGKDKERIDKDVSAVVSAADTGARDASQSGGPDDAFKLARKIAALNQLALSPGQLPPFIHTPVFLGHGTLDAKVEPQLGEEARDILLALGCDVQWHLYKDLGHWYRIPDEIDDILAFLKVLVRKGETRYTRR